MKIQDIRKNTPKRSTRRKVNAVRKIVRHHSATTGGDFWAFWNGRWKGLGWITGGYHEIILRDGTVQLCYDADMVTNGVGNHNSYTYHICLVGNGDFTEAQEQAFEERARYNAGRFGLSVNDILGHGEFDGARTSCPGIDMDKVRDRLRNSTSRPASKPKVKSNNSAYQGNSIVDYLNSVGVDSSFANRKKLAIKNGIRDYKGTASQNLELLDKLRSKPESKAKGDMQTNSIVDYLKSINVDSSFSNRKQLAVNHGIKNYTGTASQNNLLLKKMRGQ